MPRMEPADHTTVRRSGRRTRTTRAASSLSEINVVPLVDVMLVLLVIFMVTAPLMQEGFAVNLPKVTRARSIDAPPIYVTIPDTFHRDHKVQLGKEWVNVDVLFERARQALEGQLKKAVYVSADGAVSWQDIASVADQLSRGGVEQVGFLTQPKPVVR